MDHHQLVVGGQVQVQLAAGHALLEAALEAGEGIFRALAPGAAMAVDEGHDGSLNDGVEVVFYHAARALGRACRVARAPGGGARRPALR
ncbi:hypothetical protein D3C71_1770200 [compost metagenome]